MNNVKKLLALMLALAMVFSLAVPAFATEVPGITHNPAQSHLVVSDEPLLTEGQEGVLTVEEEARLAHELVLKPGEEKTVYLYWCSHSVEYDEEDGHPIYGEDWVISPIYDPLLSSSDNSVLSLPEVPAGTYALTVTAGESGGRASLFERRGFPHYMPGSPVTNWALVPYSILDAENNRLTSSSPWAYRDEWKAVFVNYFDEIPESYLESDDYSVSWAYPEWKEGQWVLPVTFTDPDLGEEKTVDYPKVIVEREPSTSYKEYLPYLPVIVTDEYAPGEPNHPDYVKTEPYLAYSTGNLFENVDDFSVAFDDVKDKLSTTLELTEGESQKIYIYEVFEGSQYSRLSPYGLWVTYISDCLMASSDEGVLSLSDPPTIDPFVTVTAGEPGSAELVCANTYKLAGVFDKDGNELEEDEIMPCLAEYFDFAGYEEKNPDLLTFEYSYEQVPRWIPAEQNVPGFEEGGWGLEVQCAYGYGGDVLGFYPYVKVERDYENRYDWGTLPITVTVKPKLTPPFGDVADDAYYADAVTWAVNHEPQITKGTNSTGTMFSPDTKCSRDQIVTFLWRAEGCEEVQTTKTFTDMPADKEFQKAILWAAENNITNGTGNGKFSPGKRCTRAEIVTLIWRALGSKDEGISKAFSDMPDNQDFQKAITWAVNHGITGGTGNGKFSPNTVCDRAQAVTFLYRAFEDDK